MAYDLNLSVNVIESISTITHFTRIQEVLRTAIDVKRSLNLRVEQEKARHEADSKNARLANKSLSINEPAEGYICPVCYFALTSQDELILHWQKEHSLDNYDNDVFQEVEMPMPRTRELLEHDNDLTVIEIPNQHLSEGEDVVNNEQSHVSVNREETQQNW